MSKFGAAGGGGLKSTQYGTVVLSSSDQSGTATITEVNTEKTFIIPLGWEATDSAAPSSKSLPRIILTNATTVTVQRGAGGVLFNDQTIGFVVVESY